MQIEYEIITEGNIKKLENGAVINRYTHVLKGAEIGKDVMIGEHCYIAKTARVGDKTRVQNGVYIWDGVEIGYNCFIGPGVRFTNHYDPHERHQADRVYNPAKTIVKDNATICAAAIIIVAKDKTRVIGEYARIGAGSVVLRDINYTEKKNGLIK